MLPAMRFQRFAVIAGDQNQARLAFLQGQDAADRRQRNSGDAARDAGFRGRGEEEFVVFAAVQGMHRGRIGA